MDCLFEDPDTQQKKSFVCFQLILDLIHHPYLSKSLVFTLEMVTLVQ